MNLSIQVWSYIYLSLHTKCDNGKYKNTKKERRYR